MRAALPTSCLVFGLALACAGEPEPDEPKTVDFTTELLHVETSRTQIRIQTEGNATVWCSSGGGEQRADPDGLAMCDVSGVEGDTENVVVRVSIDGRESMRDVEVPFQAPAVQEVKDGREGGSGTRIGCSGLVEREPGGPSNRIPLCDGESFTLSENQELVLAVRFDDAESVEIGGVQAEFDGGTATVTVPLFDTIGALETSTSFGLTSKNLSVPMVVTYAEGPAASGSLDFEGGPVLELLRSVRTRPLVFEDDAGSPGSRTSMIVVTAIGTHYEGPPVPLKDVDLIAVLEDRARKMGTCEYANEAGDTKTIERVLYDIVGTVYDRRTGKKLGSRTMRADPIPCQDWVKLNDADARYSEAHLGTAREWARGFLAD